MAPPQLNLLKAQTLKPPIPMGDTTSATRPRLPRPNRPKRRKPAPEAARNRPLNDENIHRPNGYRHQHTDGNAGKHELDAGQHDMRAELQDRAPIRS